MLRTKIMKIGIFLKNSLGSEKHPYLQTARGLPKFQLPTFGTRSRHQDTSCRSIGDFAFCEEVLWLLEKLAHFVREFCPAPYYSIV